MTTTAEKELVALMAAMRQAEMALHAAELAVRKNLETAINALLPIGLKFNRLQCPRPPYLFRVKTMRGRDHSTNTFVIASPIMVKVNVAHPALSEWSCEATPISEKTDKPMDGSSHGADGQGQKTVRLKGEFDPSWDSEEFENQRLLQVIAIAATQSGVKGGA